MTTPQRFAVVLGAAGVLAIGGSLSTAAITTGLRVQADLAPAGLLGFDDFATGPSACSNHSIEGQGATAGTENKICMGGGLVFIGPSVGQVATLIGPTVIGPAQIGSAVVSAGNVVAG